MLGFTLVELLVALTIAMVLTVVALPRLREGLQQNVASRSATLVKGVFENARANAIRTGRPYGVILHRVKNEVTPGDVLDDPLLFATQGANYCRRLSFAQVAFDYRGDIAGATAIFGMFTAGGRQYQYLDFSNATAGLVYAHANNFVPRDQQLFGVGSIIRIGPSRLPVIMITPPNGTPPPAAGFTRYVIASPFPVLPGQQMLKAGTNVTFLIETRPVPSPISPVDLPGKIVIDLAASGFSMSPTALSPAAINSIAGPPPVLRPDPNGGSNPVRGYRDVIVMFSSSGYLDGVYIDQLEAPGVYSYTKVPASESLSFLIGEIDGVVRPQTVAAFPERRGNTVPAVPAAFDHTGRKLPNFANGQASWLSINPSSGNVILKSVAMPLGSDRETNAHPELAADHPPASLIRDRLLDSRRLTRGSNR